MISVQFSSDSAPPWKSPHFFNCALWRHNKPTCNHELTRLYVSTCLELQIIINRHHKYASIVWFSSTNYRCTLSNTVMFGTLSNRNPRTGYTMAVNHGCTQTINLLQIIIFGRTEGKKLCYNYILQAYAELSEFNKCTIIIWGLNTVPRLYIQYAHMYVHSRTTKIPKCKYRMFKKAYRGFADALILNLIHLI